MRCTSPHKGTQAYAHAHVLAQMYDDGGQELVAQQSMSLAVSENNYVMTLTSLYKMAKRLQFSHMALLQLAIN